MTPTPVRHPSPNASKPATLPSYGPHAARGMMWVAAGSVVGKLASFGAQLALGWMLSKDDFAIYAIAISVSAIFISMRNGGVQRILLQRGRQYHRLASPLFKIALLFNLTTTGLILAVSPWAVDFFDSPALYPLLGIIAISVPLGTAAGVMNPKLGINLRFATATKIATASAVLRHGLAVSFALLGLGPLSFVLPLLVTAVFETVAAWWVVGLWPKGDPLTGPLLKTTLGASGWLIFGTVGAVLALQGDYLVLGRLETKATLGVYFFGYQLVGSIAAIFTSNFGSVLTPTFAHLSGEPDRQAKAFLKALRVLSFYVFPTFVFAALVAGPSVSLLWAGKWDQAIVVVQLISLSSTLHVISGLSRYLFEANGRWRIWSFTFIAGAVGTVFTAIVGAWVGDLFTIAVFISIYRFLYGIFTGLLGCWVCRVRLRDFFAAIGPPLLVCLACGLLPYYLFETQGYIENLWLKIVAITVIFSLLFLVGCLATMRERFYEAVASIRPTHTGRG